MVRIAKIRFSGSRTSYDYFCPDKTIEEGDVVFLEGKENPSYVYEIVEVADSESKATKKVLSKAEENTNVTLSSKYMDITKANQECIVNSLGRHMLTKLRVYAGTEHNHEAQKPVELKF